MEWKLRTTSLALGNSPLVMGILNITPDSFSDGGQYYTIQSAIDQARRIEDEGAHLLDIGGESTRPYSLPVSESEELSRIMPVLEALQGKLSIPISIDTTKAKVASAAIDLGAEIVNDVSGLEVDPAMVEVVAKTQVGICAMHSQGRPQSMQDNPNYSDVVQEIKSYLALKRTWLVEQGVAPERVCLDLGIGFGKTHEHNIDLIKRVDDFLSLGCPILIGHSRKGFIAKILGGKNVDRLFGTLAVSMILAGKGVHILRVHDVRAHVQALKLYAACGG